jgi:uncharacterized protein (TIGR02466 family)
MPPRARRAAASVTDDLRLLWATPIFVRRVAPPPAWNAALGRHILDRRARDPGRQRSNYGGWQSTDDLFDRDPPPELEALGALLRRALLDCLGAVMAPGAEASVRIGLSGFANVLPRGGYHTYHAHPGAHLSGSYYVDAGRPDPENPRSGRLCFYEPRAGGAMIHSRLLGFAEDFEVTPETGMIVVFPGFLGHAVHPYSGPGDRITVAFNADVEEP